MHRRIPVLCQFIIETYQGDRTACHLQGGDITSHQGTRNGDVFAMENSIQSIENDVQLDERCAAHAIDERENLLTGLESQVFNDRTSQHFSNLISRSQLNTAAT